MSGAALALLLVLAPQDAAGEARAALASGDLAGALEAAGRVPGARVAAELEAEVLYSGRSYERASSAARRALEAGSRDPRVLTFGTYAALWNQAPAEARTFLAPLRAGLVGMDGAERGTWEPIVTSCEQDVARLERRDADTERAVQRARRTVLGVSGAALLALLGLLRAGRAG